MPTDLFVFDHIAKCGGTSISTMFEVAGGTVLRFHPGGARHYEGDPGKVLICGHELFHNLPKPEGALYFTILRDPVEVFYSQRITGVVSRKTARKALDERWDDGLALIRHKFDIDPGRDHFVGVLEKLAATVAILSALTGMSLNPAIHTQRSNRPRVDYRREELERALAPEIRLWEREMQDVDTE